jgi:hypothetical protein
LLYGVAALVFIIWATRRLSLAWARDYVREVDDPIYGYETANVHRTAKPRKFWFSVAVTALLLMLAIVFLSFIAVELVSGSHV